MKDFDHASIVAKYKALQEKYPNENPRILLKDIFSQKDLIKSDFTEDNLVSLDMVLLEVAQDFEQVREDFLSLDAVRMPRSKYQEQKEPVYSRLKQRQRQLQQYEKAYQSEVGKQIRAINPKMFTPSIESISIPFELTNSETGAVVQGSVMQSFEKNIKQLTPVSSSNVRGVGQFGNELLVQFHPSRGAPMRTYRYMFDDPQQAAQAYQSLTNTGSPGRWVWQNLRGHTAGTPVDKTKLGPSLSPPGQGLPTIGGTSKSLVEYNISNRTPASKVANFDEMAKQMKRMSSNPVTNPQTGSPIEALLGTREGIRELGLSPFKMGKQLSQLPKLDFIIEEIVEDYKVKGYYSERGKPPERTWIRRHTRGEGSTIKNKPRMKPFEDWEIQLNNTMQIAKSFEKENYSTEIWMGDKKDDMGRDFHDEIYIADNVNYRHNAFSIALGNGALKKLPTDFQDVANIVFYKNITDDPNSEVNKEDIPAPYKKVGWDTKYKDVDAQISYTHRIIRIRAGSYRHPSSVRHEVGHGVWWWRVGGADQQRYREIHERKDWHLRRQGKTGKYQANDIQEFFAVQFERFYAGEHNEMFPETITFFTHLDKKFGGVNEL